MTLWRRGCARLLWLAALAVGLADCSGGTRQERVQGTVPIGAADVSGVSLPEAFPGEPDRSFVFRAERGHLLFVYFGYANCPDICPMTLSDLKKALTLLGTEAARVDLAFVTVDPVRDSAAVLVPWVRSFVPGGHALIPRTQEQLGRAETAFNARSSVTHSPGGPYDVSHTGLAYIVDDAGRIRVQWDFGTKPEVMAHDLRLLLVSAPRVDVGGVWARASPTGARTGAMYMTLTSAADDRLVGIDVPATVARRAEMHAVIQTGAGELGMKRMERVDLPAGKRIEFRPGSFHVMLVELARPLESGDTIDATLRFERAAPRPLRVPVRDEPPS